jgi:hypothetical protein
MTFPKALPILIVGLALWAGTAPAQMAGEHPLEVNVGGTEEREVGLALGLQCDDLSMAKVDLITRTNDGGTTNVLKVTGLKVGKTRCRVGTVEGRPSVFYAINVLPRAAAR